MKIYTKTGDDGTTGLFGGSRVPKHDLRIQAYGTVDELNAELGLARSGCEEEVLQRVLTQLQHQCFVVGADLAAPGEQETTVERISESHVVELEQWIDALSADLPELHEFILPGGTVLAARLHVARAVCRRAERDVALLLGDEESVTHVAKYLNRLSDLLFVMARYGNMKAGTPDTRWEHE